MMNRTIAVAIKPRVSRVINDLRETLSATHLAEYTHLSYVKITNPAQELLSVEVSADALARLELAVGSQAGMTPASVEDENQPVPAPEEGAEVATEAVAVAPKPKAFNVIATFNKTHIEVIESSVANNTPVLLVGHTGLGKTTLIKEVAKKHGKNLIRLSVHSGVTTDEILGKWIVEGGNMVWQDGLLVQAMKNGDWIVFDEINACPPDVMFAMHALLDDDRHVTLLEKKGEVVRPAEGFRFFATMNPQEDYAGTKEINMAFMSRFNAVIEIEPFHKGTEIRILESKGIPTATAAELVSTANKLREMKKEDSIMYFCGTRDIINTGLLMNSGLPLVDAVHYGIINKMSKDDREHVKGKIPDINYKSPEELIIEQLNEALAKERLTNNEVQGQLRTQVATQTKQIEALADEVKKAGQGNGNANIDAKTAKALKILKVLA